MFGDLHLSMMKKLIGASVLIVAGIIAIVTALYLIFKARQQKRLEDFGIEQDYDKVGESDIGEIV